MHCPKCNFSQPAVNPSCSHCGLVFAKYYKRQAELADIKNTSPNSAVNTDIAAPDNTPTLRQRLFTIHNDSAFYVLGRLALLVALIIYSYRLISAGVESNFASQAFMHLINLPFHEAGHVFFSPFGDFMQSLGGTLGQFIMPMICFYVFFFRQINPYAASISLWWFAQNFIDIAPYINDARAGQLSLLGGNQGHSAPYGFHDWQYLLTETGYLTSDTMLASASHTVGSILMISALLWSSLLVYKQFRVQ